ncbi:MAG: hypothetical protein ABMB14_34625 [Myxococcota bacterium]
MPVRPQDADPGWLPTLASYALGLAGVVHTLLALQFLALWFLAPVHWTFVVITLGAGALSIAVAWRLGQGRTFAAVVGTLLAPMMALLSTGLTAHAIYNGAFALYMLFAPPLAMLATLLVPGSIVSCRRAAKARAELAATYKSGPFASVLDR